jgi:hypothetical protein
VVLVEAAHHAHQGEPERELLVRSEAVVVVQPGRHVAAVLRLADVLVLAQLEQSLAAGEGVQGLRLGVVAAVLDQHGEPLAAIGVRPRDLADAVGDDGERSEQRAA